MNFLQKNAILVLSVCVLISACNKQQAPKTQMPPQPVSTISAKSEDITLKFTYPAKLVSDYDVIIKPQVSGVILEKYFKAGDMVKKGDKLFLIDPAKFKAAADGAYGQALMAKRDFERNKILFAKKAVSQKDYDTSFANFTTAQANFDNARIDLEHTEITAPFDGVVGDALINVGDYVNASTTDLVRITNLNPIYADFYISDTNKLNISRNTQSGKWELDNIHAKLNLNGQIVEGKLDFIDSVIDSSSGTVKAKAVFDNNNSTLLPGAFATITSEGFIQKNAFKIPQIAIMQDQNQVYVYTLVDGKVAKTPIHISYQDNDYAVVDSGIKNGDKIIMDNFKKIFPGSAVKEVGSQ